MDEWIKMRRELLTSPKVVRIMSALNADRFRTIGGLFAAWCVFDEHTEEGILDGYTPDLLDQMVGFPGLASSMISVGWVHFDKETQVLTALNFTEHNGRSAKRRAKESVRKMSARHADKTRTRSSSSSPSSSINKKKMNGMEKPAEVEQQHWDDWIEARRTKHKIGLPTKTAWMAVEREAKKAGLSINDAVRIAAENGWRGFNAEWITESKVNGSGKREFAW